ncbi:MAG: NADPH-dependent F420 reductase [Longimicrobiales bacterium]
MRIGVLGTGIVGETLASAMVRAAQQVMMGSRTRDNEKAVTWAQRTGNGAAHGTFADAAAFGDCVFNCTAGAVSLEALAQAGPDALGGKVLVDVANPLDFSRGMPPTLTICNTDSLGEQIQRAYPQARVVKALNTVNANVMVEPALVGSDHALLVCGNDAGAKAQVASWLVEWFGWKPQSLVDLGDITGARTTEMFVLLWVRLWGLLGTPHFGIQIAGPPAPSVPLDVTA